MGTTSIYYLLERYIKEEFKKSPAIKTLRTVYKGRRGGKVGQKKGVRRKTLST